MKTKTNCTFAYKLLDEYFKSSYSMIVLTPFLGTCPGWQDKAAVCCLQDELPMRIVADKGEVERD